MRVVLLLIAAAYVLTPFRACATVQGLDASDSIAWALHQFEQQPEFLAGTFIANDEHVRRPLVVSKEMRDSVSGFKVVSLNHHKCCIQFGYRYGHIDTLAQLAPARSGARTDAAIYKRGDL